MEDLLQGRQEGGDYDLRVVAHSGHPALSLPGDLWQLGGDWTPIDSGEFGVVRLPREILTDWLTRVALDTVQQLRQLALKGTLGILAVELVLATLMQNVHRKDGYNWI